MSASSESAGGSEAMPLCRFGGHLGGLEPDGKACGQLGRRGQTSCPPRVWTAGCPHQADLTTGRRIEAGSGLGGPVLRRSRHPRTHDEGADFRWPPPRTFTWPRAVGLATTAEAAEAVPDTTGQDTGDPSTPTWPWKL